MAYGSLGASCAGWGSGLSKVLVMSSGERKPPLTSIMRTTVNHAMATALRIMSVAAMA